METLNKRAFTTIITGHHYQAPIYSINEGVGIETIPGSVDIKFVRGSKIQGENKKATRCGPLHEHLVTIMIEDLKFKNAEFPSKETALAITNLEQARHWMEEREKVRAAAGVLGTYLPHIS